jgi:hypothetical protein
MSIMAMAPKVIRMDADRLLQKLLDTIESADLEDPFEDFEAIGMAMFALAISRQPAEEQERILARIESGQLREKVELFKPRRQMAHDGGRLLQ